MLNIQFYGEGNDVVLLHGKPVPPSTMESLATALGDSYRVIVPDMTNTGVEAPQAAQMIEETLLHHGIEKASFVGHSFGAYQAMQMAITGNIEVSDLVLLSPLSHYPDEVLAAYKELAQALEAEAIDIVAALYPQWFSPAYREKYPDTESMMREWFAPLTTADLCTVIRVECVAPDLRTNLHQISAPTYLRVGALDQATPPSWSHEIAELIPNSQLDVVDGVGHFLQYENRDATTAAIRAFLNDD